ncbi:BatA domain-containing protein [Salinimicrobium flavum]|uniref:BatA domain-containing protein n=1 Tax=Salinimicrobium flavum TaxID=1737065 RepID=A0ABW5IZ05_9FLAO
MHFKHPEILYALFLVVIPVLVHLFQLRKFRTEKFTNVKFLRKAVIQTRKSSRIKKWLILATRILLLVSVILAFAQPYFPPEAGEIKEQETVIYLDNSYSLQARGRNGILYKRAIQDLLESLPDTGRLTFFANDTEMRDTDADVLQRKLQQLDYSAYQPDWKTISLMAQNLFSNSTETRKNFIVISDFQKTGDEAEIEPVPGINTHLVHLTPETITNSAIDTAFISEKTPDELKIKVKLKATGEPQSEIAVALYDDNDLLARKTLTLENDLTATTEFLLPSRPLLRGKFKIEDNNLTYDNELFFSIDEPETIEVVVIGDADAGFLERIYTSPEFRLHLFESSNIDYNLLSQANLVVLNEPREIPFNLGAELKNLMDENISLILIPSENMDLQGYNSFLKSTGSPLFGDKQQQEKLVTEIAFGHPLYRNVFQEQVRNFDYPGVQSYFTMNYGGNGILSFDNGRPFLLQQENLYIFTAALNRNNSDFKASPLIVPSFYNIGARAISPSQMYFTLGQAEQLNVRAQLDRDEILKLHSSEETFIPRQQSYRNKVELSLEEVPSKVGHYELKQDSVRLRSLSFNSDRLESKLIYMEPAAANGVELHSNIPEVFGAIQSAAEVNALWKWFVIFALIFFLAEMLILKFFK